MKRVFLDTSGWFAALSPREAHHAESLRAYRKWLKDGYQLVTTNLVVAEMHILMCKYRGPAEGLRFLDHLYDDPSHSVVFVDRDIERAAIDRWLRRLTDQRLSLADAVSFETMKTNGIRHVLSLDDHFSIAGFLAVPSLP